MAVILQLIATLGIPLAEKVYYIVSKHHETNIGPTPEMWKALRDAENESHTAFASALKPTG